MAVEIINNLSNGDFIDRYAKPGCIGLVGADTLIDNSIKKMQRFITADGKESLWSHAFMYSGKRYDGHWWIIESDLEFHPKQMKLGVQENRAEKYFDEKVFPNLAILDFDLSEEFQNQILSEALDLVSGKAQYSIREVFGALFTLQNKEGRAKENVLAQENSFFCSAMVQHCYAKVNLNLANGVSVKNITPEDVANTKIPHRQFRLIR